jgi:hypothetical protein
MEKRRAKRITAGFKADIIYNGVSYPGVIENISASGISVLTNPIEAEVEFVAYEAIELIFEDPSGNEVTLECTIMWSSPIPPHNARHRIGMELVGRPWDKISFFL